MTMKAIRIRRPGGLEALEYTDVEEPVPGAGEVLVANDFAGVNFIDIYHRSGQYPLPLPLTLGVEGAGTVVALGPGVDHPLDGARVAYNSPYGSYAERVTVQASSLVRLPDTVSTREAAALLLQGLTAHYLATSTFALGPGDTCLVHAAAGGVGLLLCQIAKLRGATVIATVSSADKAALARTAGADHVVRYDQEDFVAACREQTHGRGVEVVYDSVGRATFDRSLDCLAPRGLLALFGQASGPVAAFDPQLLNKKGSVYLTRPTLAHYVATPEALDARMRELFQWLESGQLRLRIGGEWPLAQAAAAQRALEGRLSTGKLLLRVAATS